MLRIFSFYISYQPIGIWKHGKYLQYEVVDYYSTLKYRGQRTTDHLHRADSLHRKGLLHENPANWNRALGGQSSEGSIQPSR